MQNIKLWTIAMAMALFEKSLLEILFEAQLVHRKHFIPGQIQVSSLLSIKTGACPEDCKYCPQSARYHTGLETGQLIQLQQVIDAAKKAYDAGSTRFCMGAAWKNPRDRDLPLKNYTRSKKTGSRNMYDSWYAE